MNDEQMLNIQGLPEGVGFTMKGLPRSMGVAMGGEEALKKVMKDALTEFFDEKGFVGGFEKSQEGGQEDRTESDNSTSWLPSKKEFEDMTISEKLDSLHNSLVMLSTSAQESNEDDIFDMVSDRLDSFYSDASDDFNDISDRIDELAEEHNELKNRVLDIENEL